MKELMARFICVDMVAGSKEDVARFFEGCVKTGYLKYAKEILSNWVSAESRSEVLGIIKTKAQENESLAQIVLESPLSNELQSTRRYTSSRSLEFCYEY